MLHGLDADASRPGTMGAPVVIQTLLICDKQRLFLHHCVKLHFARCRTARGGVVSCEQIGSNSLHEREDRISRPHHILAETTWRREVGGRLYVGLSQPISRRRAY
jgi:hypothetical protein